MQHELVARTDAILGDRTILADLLAAQVQRESRARRGAKGVAQLRAGLRDEARGRLVREDLGPKEQLPVRREDAHKEAVTVAAEAVGGGPRALHIALRLVSDLDVQCERVGLREIIGLDGPIRHEEHASPREPNRSARQSRMLGCLRQKRVDLVGTKYGQLEGLVPGRRLDGEQHFILAVHGRPPDVVGPSNLTANC